MNYREIHLAHLLITPGTISWTLVYQCLHRHMHIYVRQLSLDLGVHFQRKTVKGTATDPVSQPNDNLEGAVLSCDLSPPSADFMEIGLDTLGGPGETPPHMPGAPRKTRAAALQRVQLCSESALCAADLSSYIP